MSTDDSSSNRGGRDDNEDTSTPNSTPPPTFADIDRWNYHTTLKQFGSSLQAAANAVFPNDKKSRYSQVSVLMLSWADEDPCLPVSREIDELEIISQQRGGKYRRKIRISSWQRGL